MMNPVDNISAEQEAKIKAREIMQAKAEADIEAQFKDADEH